MLKVKLYTSRSSNYRKMYMLSKNVYFTEGRSKRYMDTFTLSITDWKGNFDTEPEH